METIVSNEIKSVLPYFMRFYLKTRFLISKNALYFTEK
jgi:hypothetical protein